jgi:hypothetical protein
MGLQDCRARLESVVRSSAEHHARLLGDPAEGQETADDPTHRAVFAQAEHQGDLGLGGVGKTQEVERNAALHDLSRAFDSLFPGGKKRSFDDQGGRPASNADRGPGHETQASLTPEDDLAEVGPAAEAGRRESPAFPRERRHRARHEPLDPP